MKKIQSFYVTLRIETESDKKITEEGAKRMLKDIMHSERDIPEEVIQVRITDVIETTKK